LLNNFSAGSPDVGAKSKLHQIMNYISNNSADGSSVKSDRNLAQDASEYANQSRSSNHDDLLILKGYQRDEDSLHEDQRKFLEEKGKELHTSSSIYDEEVKAYNKSDPRQEEFLREEYQFEFYVDNYSDDKIKEIISIFRNDFKPPKNLWIENMVINSPAESNYFNDVFADDDNYNETEENSPKIGDSAHHNEEIDDIGYNIFSEEKKKQAQKDKDKDKPKPNDQKEEKKAKKVKKPNEDENQYSDRIKPIEDKDKKAKEDKKSKKEGKILIIITVLEPKVDPKSSKDSKKEKKLSPKPKPKPSDIKTTKAKDGLNIEINGAMPKISEESEENSKEQKVADGDKVQDFDEENNESSAERRK
jgi:hypothetical protein